MQLAERSLRAIEDTQRTLNAFRVVCAEQALADAAQADRRRAAGAREPLLGVPVAIKDDVDLAGHPTAFGCAGAFAPAQRDCEMVSRLRAAGAVIVGKTNSPELGLYPFTEGRAFGAVRNPWSLGHTPGGSSGGAAAAVAAGIVPAAVGSDGAGSVRIPASWCGLVGLKPQRGRISTWPQVDPFNGLECLGPLTRTVADTALLLDVLSGPHPGELGAPPLPPEPFATAAARDPGALRVGVAINAPFSGVRVRLDREIRAGVQRIAAVLAGLGHTVSDVRPRYGLMGWALLCRGEAGVYQWAERVPDPELLDSRTRETIRTGRMLSNGPLALARRLEPRMARRLSEAFASADVLLAPTTATAPLAIGAADGLGTWATERLISAACPYAWPWNLVGWPAVTVPAGITAAGLPFGAQLLGPPNSEPLLLALAAQLEAAERWPERLAST